MKQISVAIVTDDMPYGEALMRGLRYRSRVFFVTLHSTRGFIDGWKKIGLGFRRNYNIILWDGADGERIRGGNIVWITDMIPVPMQMPNGDDTTHVQYRYDTASGFYSKIMCIVDETGADVPVIESGDTGDPRTRIIAFGSWRGGAGCTTLCRAMGQELTRFFGKRVLWLSLDGIEPENSSEGPVSMAGDGGVDRFLYEILADGIDEMRAGDHMENISGSASSRKKQHLVLERFMMRDGYGLETLRPSMGRNPLPQLKGEDAAKVIASIAGRGEFDALLLDVGACTSDGAGEMIAFADRICLVGEKGAGGRKNRYLSWIRNSTGSGMGMDRVVFVDDNPEAEGDDEILLEGKFGKYIHALTEALWYNEIEQIA